MRVTPLRSVSMLVQAAFALAVLFAPQLSSAQFDNPGAAATPEASPTPAAPAATGDGAKAGENKAKANAEWTAKYEEGVRLRKEGKDLTKAMTVFEEIFKAAQPDRRLVAEATLEWGQCNMALGSQIRAWRGFEAIINQYPEFADLVTKARLAMAEAPSQQNFLPLGQEMQLSVNDNDTDLNYLVDLDRGRLYSLESAGRGYEDVKVWIRLSGIDAGGGTDGISPGLNGMDMVVIPVPNEIWSEPDPLSELERSLHTVRLGTPAVMSALPQLPVTYIFKTREGSIGILQILSNNTTAHPPHLRVRYRLLRYSQAYADRARNPTATQLVQRGWEQWSGKAFAQAEQYFIQATQLEENNAEAWNGAGWAQMSQNRIQDAIDSLESALEIKPDHPRALSALGWAHKLSGKPDKAMATWDKALAADPRQTFALQGKGETLLEQGKAAEAVVIFQRWTEVEPNNAAAQAKLRTARMSAGSGTE